jgi:pyrimidine oxygenase
LARRSLLQSEVSVAGEYVKVLKELWRHGAATHHSQYFNLEDCQCFPVPRHTIPIVSAGVSPAGFEFVAEFADRSFITVDRWHLKEKVDHLKAAGVRTGRKVGAYALYQLVAAETDREANDLKDRIVEGIDLVALGNMLSSASLDSNKDGSSKHQLASSTRTPEQGHGAFMSIPVVCGCYESVAAQLGEIAAETGVDGFLFSFPDFVNGIKHFGERIRPLLSVPT